MKAVIPCAKKEEDLWPFIESKPTGLMPITGKPVIKHLIQSLTDAGITDIYIVTNYREEDFLEMFGDFTNVNAVTQEEIEGTGKAVEECEFIDEDFLVVNGDVIVSQRDIEKLIEKHNHEDADGTVLATEEDKPEKFGVLSIKNDKVVSLEEKPEKPENTLVNTGVYVFSPEIFDFIETGSLTAAVKKMIEDKEVYFEFPQDYWIDIGSPKKLWEADRIKRESLIKETEISDEAEIDENVSIEGEAKIEKGAEINPGTVLEGKVYIGRNCTVGPNTVVRDSSIGHDSQVRSADIDDSVLFEKNIIDSSTVIENSILGEETDVKSNTSIRESFIGPRSFVEINNSIYGVKFVPDARTDLGEISK